jgi:hypothetical protein
MAWPAPVKPTYHRLVIATGQVHELECDPLNYVANEFEALRLINKWNSMDITRYKYWL